MHYTVKQLSSFAGVSVRTLHYYDEIGLLKPSFLKENGYRYYEEKELLKLQQILFFRELEFSLEEIREIISASNFDMVEALKDQRHLLEMKRQRIDGLVQTIEKTIVTMKGGDSMKSDDLFAAFDDTEMNKYKEEARQRWGHTDAYKQSAERTKHWTKEDYRRIAEEGKAFTQKLANVMGLDIQNDEVQKLIALHYQGIQQFYDCPLDMYRNLADMYITDPRFTANYDKVKPGLAKFIRDAIYYYADVHAK